MSKNPLFITFEGIEGAGKSTQVKLLSAWLDECHIAHICTREPGGTVLGESIRELVLHQEMQPYSELLLMFAARYEHVETVIKPALQAGKWVLCDRFTEASFAYQGYGRDLGEESVAFLEKAVLGIFQPTLTFWFDLPLTVALERAKQRGTSDRFEKEAQAFFQRVHQGYAVRASEHSQRIKRINADQTIDQIQYDLRQYLYSSEFGLQLGKIDINQ